MEEVARPFNTEALFCPAVEEPSPFFVKEGFTIDAADPEPAALFVEEELVSCTAELWLFDKDGCTIAAEDPGWLLSREGLTSAAAEPGLFVIVSVGDVGLDPGAFTRDGLTSGAVELLAMMQLLSNKLGPAYSAIEIGKQNQFEHQYLE